MQRQMARFRKKNAALINPQTATGIFVDMCRSLLQPHHQQNQFNLSPPSDSPTIPLPLSLRPRLPLPRYQFPRLLSLPTPTPTNSPQPQGSPPLLLQCVASFTAHVLSIDNYSPLRPCAGCQRKSISDYHLTFDQNCSSVTPPTHLKL